MLYLKNCTCITANVLASFTTWIIGPADNAYNTVQIRACRRYFIWVMINPEICTFACYLPIYIFWAFRWIGIWKYNDTMMNNIISSILILTAYNYNCAKFPIMYTYISLQLVSITLISCSIPNLLVWDDWKWDFFGINRFHTKSLI